MHKNGNYRHLTSNKYLYYAIIEFADNEGGFVMAREKTVKVTDVTDERWAYFVNVLKTGDAQLVREFLSWTSACDISKAINAFECLYEIKFDE